MAVTNVAARERAPGSVAAFRHEVLGGARPGLAYHGRLGELTALWLKTLGLSLVTLGFYRFWGRTRIRKYLWSRISLDGDRFEYDGTGGELFRRFLIAVVVLAPLFFGPSLLHLAGAHEGIVQAVASIQGALIGFLALVGYYAGRRYRLSRTIWRGIRGGLDGSAGRYALLAVLHGGITLLTLGIYLPWQRVKLWRYEANNMRAGDERFGFDGRGRGLLRVWLVSIGLLVIASIALVGGTFWIILANAPEKDAGGIAPLLTALAPFAAWASILLIALVLWPLFTAPFTARWWSYMASNTHIRGVRLRAEIGWWPLLCLQLGNLALLVLTFGLGGAFAAHRTMKFWCRRLEVAGVETLEDLTQETPPPRAGAEGLAQLLGESGFA